MEDNERKATYTLTSILAMINMVDNTLVQRRLVGRDVDVIKTSVEILEEIKGVLETKVDYIKADDRFRELLAENIIFKILNKMAQSQHYNYLISIREFIDIDGEYVDLKTCRQVVDKIREVVK